MVFGPNTYIQLPPAWQNESRKKHTGDSRYAWEGLAKVVFDGQVYSGIDTCVTCYGETGAEVRTEEAK